MKEKKVIRQIEVADDWHPCIDGNKVDLNLMIVLVHYPSGKHKDGERYCVKLSAWGGDDTGVEIERICQDLPSALKEYDLLSEVFNSIPDGLTRSQLCEKYGFKPA